MKRTALLATFATFPERLGEAARAASDRLTSPGEWGPTEIVQHLILVEEEVFQSRLARLAAEDRPHWSWVEPGLAPWFDGVPLAEILAAFAADRAATAETIEALDDAGWARSGMHDTYGVLDVEGLLRIAADHDVEHLASLTV